MVEEWPTGPSRPAEPEPDPDATKKFWLGIGLSLVISVVGGGLLGIPVIIGLIIAARSRQQPMARGMIIGFGLMMGLALLALGACGGLLIALSGNSNPAPIWIWVALGAVVAALFALVKWIRHLLR